MEENEINLDELLAKFNELAAEVSRAEEAATAAEFEYREAEKTMRKLYREQQEKKAALSNVRSSLRSIQPEIERAKRFAEAKIKRDQKLAEFKERSKELDELTGNAKWRNDAKDFQVEGGKRLAVAERGILADKRGLGKTLTSLIWADMVGAKRILVIAPNDICTQFEDEVKHWAPDRYIMALRGLTPPQRKIIYPVLKTMEEFIVIINYEAWRKDKGVIDDLVSAGIDTLICDEAHKIKSHDKITARGVFQVAYRPNFCPECKVIDNYEGPWEVKSKDRFTSGFSKELKDAEYHERFYGCPLGHKLESTVKHVLTMTGTPILNKPQELFSLLHLVDPNRFSDPKQYLYDYCETSWQTGKWVFKPGGLKRLTAMMSEFFIQRTPNDVGSEVPPPAVKVYVVEKDKVKYRRQYEAEKMLREKATLILESGEQVNFFYILETILRERQIMTWPSGIQIKDPETKEIICRFDVEESQKVDEACDLLTDLIEEGERVVVFSKFKAPLYEMQRRFADCGVIATGDQSDHLRDRVKRDFDLKYASGDHYNWQVCFATYDAFGTGINLNAARHLILLDDEWNPGMEDQAIGRIDRMNNTDQANVHIFRVKDSIDDWMVTLLEQKKKMLDGFNTEITAADLLAHLKGAI